MNRFDPPGGRPWGLFALCGASMLLNVVLGTRMLLSPGTHEPAVIAPEMPAPAAVVHEIADPPVPVQPVQPIEPVEDEAFAEIEPEVPAEPAAPEIPDDVRTASLKIEHSLARTFSNGIGDGGDEVAAVVARLFVWDLDLRRDLQAGDHVTVAWEGSGPGLQIPAARYRSKKLGTLRAYRYTAEGDTWPSWWNEEGVEVSRALKDSPIEGYEQITSLLKDRPRHRGMDFKAPEGTPIVSPRDGVVTRVDWNVKNNGNCVEVRYPDGTLARFLHLSQTDVKEGARVAKGSVVGLSGNTGHSTAPHLHYELEKNEQVVDPIDYHGLTRRTLDPAERARFDARIARLDAWLEAADRK
ncbi:MAG: M23 family metallopeptidase [Alphaproteobacteria bacterium]|nr:M23 family metallopeptidase [Alphaproteobacteria bacterium]